MLRKYQPVRWSADIGVGSLRIVLEQTSRVRRSATSCSAAMPGVLAFHWPCGLTLRPAHPTSPLSVCQRQRAGQRQRRGRHCRATQRGQTAFPALPSGLPHGYALPATGRKIPPLQKDTQAEPLRARQGSAVKPSAPDNGRSTAIASAPGITALEHALANGSDGVPTRPHASEEQHSQCFAGVNQSAGAQILVSAR